ncbi:MAG: Rieske 2Fe-2S domain-containing protein [Deltaproteobacteria bacterium]|nr:Rieske 2Fe-2S domain-containing protein [Deltaproteobacteria bacterium]
MTSRLFNIGKPLPPSPPGQGVRFDQPDWAQASPKLIREMLSRALARPSGGWLVVDASRHIASRPRHYVVAGRELVAWRAAERILVAPNACPHMKAPLSEGRVSDGKLVCPWHGLRLGAEGFGSWKPYDSFDDGVLTWVRFGADEASIDRPILAPRPERFIDGVVRVEARCDPSDVIANRLDPWHGAHFHPHTFARLRVTNLSADDVLSVRVAYRVAGPVCVEVDCTFHSPEPNTIVMTIVGGDGVGSVVETHASPIEPGRTAIVEATLATSDRAGFRLAMLASSVVRPFILRTAHRLWMDDVTYAERSYAARVRTSAPGVEG